MTASADFYDLQGNIASLLIHHYCTLYERDLPRRGRVDLIYYISKSILFQYINLCSNR